MTAIPEHANIQIEYPATYTDSNGNTVNDVYYVEWLVCRSGIA